MYTRLRKMLQNSQDKGFTLIELLVVIVIIGILAAIAIPVFLSQRAKAYDASAKSDIHNVATEMETVYTDALAYPTSVTAAAASNGGTVLTFPDGVAPATDTVTLSPGNTASIFLNTNKTAYCITVVPATGTQTWVYESDQGGLQPNTVATCPTGTGGAYTATNIVS